VYNKAVDRINDPACRGESKIEARDRLVTDTTRKGNGEYAQLSAEIVGLGKRKKAGDGDVADLEARIAAARQHLKQLPQSKNASIEAWELQTPKDIRGAAVFDVFAARKSAIENLKRGNIRKFKIGFRKKTNQSQSMLLPKTAVKVNKDGDLVIYPSVTKASKVFVLGKRTKRNQAKDLRIEHDVRVYKHGGKFWLLVPVAAAIPAGVAERKTERYCGIDPGTRTFMTCFGYSGNKEIETPTDELKRIREKIRLLKGKKNKLLRKEQNRGRLRKATFNRLERRAKNVVDQLHWDAVKELLSNYDVLFLGDIKSHDIVKGGKFRGVNRAIMEVKFYQFKLRLLYKAGLQNKLVVPINEAYTTKTCSFCGTLNDPGSSKIYTCDCCGRVTGRDTNAAKNILMKGIIAAC
jgi:putative transposase